MDRTAIQIIVKTFSISCSDIATGAARQISRSTASRIINGSRAGSPAQRAAFTRGLMSSLMSRVDSGFLFSQQLQLSKENAQ